MTANDWNKEMARGKRKKVYGKIHIGILFLLILCLSVTACAKKAEETESKENENKVYHLGGLLEAPYKNGWIYIGSTGGNIHYFDQKTGKSTPLCQKKNCKHEAWDENTPIEQRCDSYREFPVSAVIVRNNTLYSLSNNYLTDKVNLYRSDIDGAEVETIAELNMFFVSGSAFFDEDFLYYTSQTPNTDGQIDNPNGNGYFTASINRVNLSTGKDEMVSEMYQGISTSMQIIGKHSSNIYYKVFSLKPGFNEMDGMESMEARIYALDLSTGKSEEVFSDIRHCFTINDMIVDDSLYLTSQEPEKEEKRGNHFYFPSTIYRIDLKNNKQEELATFDAREDIANRCDDWFYFPLEDSGQMKFVNVFSGEEKILKEEPFEEYYLAGIHNDQLLLLVRKFEIDPANSNKDSYEMITLSGSLSDYFAGEFEGKIIQ